MWRLPFKGYLVVEGDYGQKIPLPIVAEGRLTQEELVTWRQIEGELESLLDAEEKGDFNESSS